MKGINELEELFTSFGYGVILNDPYFIKLKAQSKHFASNTYNHSLRTAYLMFLMTKDKHTIPIGLLHDFSTRPTKEEFRITDTNTWYATAHPKLAVKNALGMVSYYEDNEKWLAEKMRKEDFDAIRTHMFPLTFTIPKTKNAWLLTIADKITAITDIFPY